MLTGSPPCDQFSQLQNINKYRVSADKRREKMDKAVAQVRDLSERPGVCTVRGPMCRWATVATDRRGLQGTGYVRKETGWMTNHPGLAELLRGECSNKTEGKPWHRHVHLIGGLTRSAARYPPALVRAVLRALTGGERTIECTGRSCCRSSS